MSGNDPLRTGWYPDQPGLNPSVGGGCAFGQLWSAPVNGQVYASPIVEPDVGPNGTLLVATETNNIYGKDAVTGAQLWNRNVGPAWNPADLGTPCSSIQPSIGITSTPAIDSATNTAYVVAKTYDPPGQAAYVVHAVNLSNGTEKAGFTPLKLQGQPATNDPTATFDAKMHLQRPGLLLMGGQVYFGFGSLCDIANYRGWVAGVNATTGALTTLWTNEAQPIVPPTPSPNGGIWQSGGRLVEYNGDILLTSGNGVIPPAPDDGNSLPTPTTLGMAVTRLHVQAMTGALQAVDYWIPCNAKALSDIDFDLGTGAPLVLPADTFGSPRLVIVEGKDNTVYALNADDLGGYRQGPADSCPDGAGHPGDTLVTKGSFPGTAGAWATPAMWPGEGGSIFIPSPTFNSPDFPNAGKLNAWHVNGSGAQRTLSRVGESQDAYGFGSSSAIVTSDGKAAGSALVWVIWMPDSTGVGAQLLAYDPNPVNGLLPIRGNWPIGTGTKFNTPTVHAGRIYLGTQDGHVLAFGVTQAAAASQPPPQSPSRTATVGGDAGPDPGE